MNTKQLGRWIKLYRNPSASWLALSHSTQGLGYGLMRVCDDAGRIECGTVDPFEIAMRLCAIGPTHRRLAKADFAALLADGFIRVEGTALVIPNFVEAQSVKTPEAVRKDRQRAREASAPADRRTTDVRPTRDTPTTDVRPTYDRPSELTPRNSAGGGVTSHAHSEKRREEKTPPVAPLAGGERPAAEVETPPNPTPRVLCPTVEDAHPRPRLDRDQAAEALRVSSGGIVETRAPAPQWLALLELCASAPYTLDDLAAVGRYLAAGVSWVRAKRVTVGYLAGGRTPGSILEQLVSEANERERKPRPAPPSPTKHAAPERPFVPATPASLDAHRRKAGLPSLLADAEPQETARVA